LGYTIVICGWQERLLALTNFGRANVRNSPIGVNLNAYDTEQPPFRVAVFGGVSSMDGNLALKIRYTAVFDEKSKHTASRVSVPCPKYSLLFLWEPLICQRLPNPVATTAEAVPPSALSY